jgi:hypothetical protein
MAFRVNSEVDSSYYSLRRVQEGKPYTFFAAINYSAATITDAAIASFFVNIGKFLLLEEITIHNTNDTPIEIAIQIPTTIGNVDQTTNNIIGTRSSDSTQFDLRGETSAKTPLKFAPSNGLRLYDKTTVIVVTRNTGVTNFTGRLVIAVSGVLYDADMNWDADFTILGAGDSILSALNGGTEYYDDMIYFSRIRDYYKYNKTLSSIFYKGQNVRKVNKAEGGRDSSNAESWRRDGFYNIQKTNLTVYNMMVNDAGTSPITQQKRDIFKANLRKFIDWHQSVNYKKPILICSGTPQTDNTAEANLVLLRQDAYDVINSYSGRKSLGTGLSISNSLSLRVLTDIGDIIYVNTGIAFDRTDIQFYNNSSGNGDGIHPNAIRGHAAIFNNCIKPALDAWLPKLI